MDCTFTVEDVSSCSTFPFKRHHLPQAALVFCFVAKQITNSIIDAINFQEQYTKSEEENAASEHATSLGSG